MCELKRANRLIRALTASLAVMFRVEAEEKKEDFIVYLPNAIRLNEKRNKAVRDLKRARKYIKEGGL